MISKAQRSGDRSKEIGHADPGHVTGHKVTNNVLAAVLLVIRVTPEACPGPFQGKLR